MFFTRKEVGLNSLEKLRAASGVRIGAPPVGHGRYVGGRIFAYIIGMPFIISPGTPRDRVHILQEAMRKFFRDPEFSEEYRKLVGEEAPRLMPEEMEKVIREIPRDHEVIDLFKKVTGADPSPPR